MNDSQVVRRLKQLDACRQKIQDIIDEIQESDHQNARQIADALYEQCWFPAWPEHVVGPELLAHPERWELTPIPYGETTIPGRLRHKKIKPIAASVRGA